MRNIVNFYQIEAFLRQRELEHPRQKKFIYENLKNYLLRESPIKEIKKPKDVKFSGPYHEVLVYDPELIHNTSLILSFLDEEYSFKKDIRLTYQEALKKAEKWEEKEESKKEIPEGKIIEKYKFKDGFKMVQLYGKQSFLKEGKLMANCLAEIYDEPAKIYSLRNVDNKPVLNMYVSVGKEVEEAREKFNKDMSEKYFKYFLLYCKERNYKYDKTWILPKDSKYVSGDFHVRDLIIPITSVFLISMGLGPALNMLDLTTSPYLSKEYYFWHFMILNIFIHTLNMGRKEVIYYFKVIIKIRSLIKEIE